MPKVAQILSNKPKMTPNTFEIDPKWPKTHQNPPKRLRNKPKYDQYGLDPSKLVELEGEPGYPATRESSVRLASPSPDQRTPLGKLRSCSIGLAGTRVPASPIKGVPGS